MLSTRGILKMKIRLLATVMAATIVHPCMAQSVAVSTATLRLEDVVRVAIQTSAAKESAEHGIRAMHARITQVGAMPDPSVSIGWAGKLAPMVTMPGDASSYRGITLSQTFPYPGKRQLAKKIAKSDADAASADSDTIVRKVELEAKQAFFEYLYTQQALEIAEENKDLLAKLAASAEAQYRAGKATQRDVLRAQTETTLLLKTIEELRLTEEQTRVEVNRLMHQPLENDLGKAQAPTAGTLLYTLDEVTAQAQTNSPELAKDSKMIDRNRASEELAVRQFRPDIGVSYSFQQRTNLPDMNGLSVTVSLPTSWRSKQREAVHEATETLRASQAAKAESEARTRAEVRTEWAAIESADRTLRLIHEAILPQSELTFESSLSAYQNGRIEFQTMLSDLATRLDVRMTEARVVANRQEAIARIESLTGEKITRDTAAVAEVVR